jgi:hypothetical protein
MRRDVTWDGWFTQRLTFDSSSPNGILLFRELSKLIVAYGTRVLSLGKTHTSSPTPSPQPPPRARSQGAGASATKRRHSELTSTRARPLVVSLVAFFHWALNGF